MKNKIFVNKFNGITNSVDPSLLGFQGSVNIENYNLNNAVLEPVEGSVKVGVATANANSILGLKYFRGVTSNLTNVENFLMFSKDSTRIYANLLSASGSSPSFSTSPLSFSTAPTYGTFDWDAIIYDGKIIASNKNEVYTLDYGNSTTFNIGSKYSPIIGIPSNIGIAISYASNQGISWVGMQTTTANSGGFDDQIGIQRIKFDSTGTAVGLATTSIIKLGDWWYGSESDSSNAVQHVYYTDKTNKNIIRYGHRAYNNTSDRVSLVTTTPQPFSITLWTNDFASPNKEYLTNQLYRDFFFLNFQVNKSYSNNWSDEKYKTVFNKDKFKVTFIDNIGNSFVSTVTCEKQTNGQNLDTYIIAADTSTKDKFDTTAFDWSNVAKIKIEGEITWATFNTLGLDSQTGTTYAYCFDMNLGLEGGVNLALNPIDSNGKTTLQFGTVRYDVNTQEVSQVHNIQTFTIPVEWASGDYYGYGNYSFQNVPRRGRWLDITYPVGGTSTSQSWLVVNDYQGSWRKVGFTTSTGISTSAKAVYRYNADDVLKLPDINISRSYIHSANCLTNFMGWVVYGLNKPLDNIAHSYIGDPLQLFSNAIDDSLDVGGTYTLSDYNDIPVAMTSVGNVLYIFSDQAVYCQSGNYPSQLTPIRKIGGNLPGIANQFALTSVNTLEGQGVVYVTKACDRAFFIAANPTFADVTFKAIELTENIKNTFKSYLLESNSDINNVRVTYRTDNDSIIISCGINAWIWTRPDFTGKRQVIKRKLSDSSIEMKYLSMPVNSSSIALNCFATGIGSTGLFQFKPTVYTDNNKPIISTYASGTLSNTSNLRMAQLWVDRLYNTQVGVSVTSTRTTWNSSISTTTSNLPIPWTVQGFKHNLSFTQTNSATSGINAYWVEMNGTIAERNTKTNL